MPEPVDALHLSQAFHHPFQVMSAGVHAGLLPDHAALLRIAGGVVLSAVKLAEDGDGLIVRYYEAQGRDGVAAITFWQAPKQALRVNLLEQPVETGNPTDDVRLEGGTVLFASRAYGIGSLRVRF